MTNSRLLLSALFAFALFAGCAKDGIDPTPPNSATPDKLVNPSGIYSPLARHSGPNYSQSISIETANQMVGSYLTSVNYPSQDTALRSLIFDADTLRAYLRDTSIVTLKFYIAHTPSYAQNTQTYGKYAGFRPAANTLIVAGLNNNEQVVRNSQNGVYEHMIACPVLCTGNAALIQ